MIYGKGKLKQTYFAWKFILLSIEGDNHLLVNMYLFVS